MLDEPSLIILRGANLGASNVTSLRDMQLDHDRRRAERSLSEFTKMALTGVPVRGWYFPKKRERLWGRTSIRPIPARRRLPQHNPVIV